MPSFGRYLLGRALRLLERDAVALILFAALLVGGPTGLASVAGEVTKFAEDNLQALSGAASTNTVKPFTPAEPSPKEPKQPKRGTK